MEAFRWALIGTGTLAKKVAKEITASGRHSIVSVYTRRPENCAAFAGQYGALAARTSAEAITAPGVEGVYIVTPHTSHCQYTLEALTLRKPVLCEKPVTTDVRQAKEMIDLAKARGLYFAEAMWTWFSPIARQVKSWLDAGEYGDIRNLRMTYHLNSVRYAPRVSDPNVGGGALLDVGIYPVTYIYRLFGKPLEIRCSGTVAGGVDMGEEIRLIYPGEKTYTISTSIRDYWGLERMKLIGTKGKTNLWNYHRASQVCLRRFRGQNERFRGDGSICNEFDRVAEEIREGRTESHFVPHQATLEVMELLDECRRQMKLVYPFEL